MKYLYVVNAELATMLLDAGQRVLQQTFDIEQKPIWVFEYNPDCAACFDINDTSVRGACFVSDRLTMRF